MVPSTEVMRRADMDGMEALLVLNQLRPILWMGDDRIPKYLLHGQQRYQDIVQVSLSCCNIDFGCWEPDVEPNSLEEYDADGPPKFQRAVVARPRMEACCTQGNHRCPKDTRERLTRWAFVLQEFSFTVGLISGRNNKITNALSRPVQGNELQIEAISVNGILVDDEELLVSLKQYLRAGEICEHLLAGTKLKGSHLELTELLYV
ncbi:uncharacterized protein DEA37_0010168 [Paragonimus westermani]|uniref:Uncharacterized protein n=1 Tax=Paragonimus westermani TaxID=34504 RepID=A0A5J4NBS6_9TREM|nr:uncharacterized protein DEA37_0010168 [Paragonimus westermani]